MSDEAARVLSPDEALATVLREVARGPVEHVPLAEAAGRVLAAPLVATEDLWPFARAAMDGIAARAVDVVAASPEHPVRLLVIGAVYTGDGPPRRASRTAGLDRLCERAGRAAAGRHDPDLRRRTD